MFSKATTLVIPMIIFINMTSIAQSGKFTLLCMFDSLPNNTKVFLITQEGDTVSSAKSDHSRFTFSGILPQNGRFHFIAFDTLISRVNSNAIFVLSQKIIHVRGTLNKPEVFVKGSSAHDDYVDLKKLHKEVSDEIQKEIIPINQSIANIIRERRKVAKSREDTIYYEKKIDSCRNITENIITRYTDLFKPWFESHKNSLYAPYALEQLSKNLGFEYTEKIYQQFPIAVKNSYYGIQLKKSFDFIKGKEDLSRVKKLPNFSVFSISGEKAFILDLIKDHKLTLIDMWASWCTPCRAEIPSLKKIFESYEEKGVNIIGVSSDKDLQKWKQAIIEDKTSWNHFSEDPTFSLTKLFGVVSIPAYILVNNSGEILSFDCAWSEKPSFGGLLRGDELSNTLNNYLK